jgi:hypothetical protein
VGVVSAADLEVFHKTDSVDDAFDYLTRKREAVPDAKGLEQVLTMRETYENVMRDRSIQVCFASRIILPSRITMSSTTSITFSI